MTVRDSVVGQDSDSVRVFGKGARGHTVLCIERLPRRTLVSSVSRIAAVSTACKNTPLTRHEDESDGRNDSRARHRPRSGLDAGGKAETVAVPASALRLFLNLLTEMSQGNAVTLIPTHAEWTTQLTEYGID
jgi:hypothetical protein